MTGCRLWPSGYAAEWGAAQGLQRSRSPRGSVNRLSRHVGSNKSGTSQHENAGSPQGSDSRRSQGRTVQKPTATEEDRLCRTQTGASEAQSALQLQRSPRPAAPSASQSSGSAVHRPSPINGTSHASSGPQSSSPSQGVRHVPSAQTRPEAQSRLHPQASPSSRGLSAMQAMHTVSAPLSSQAWSSGQPRSMTGTHWVTAQSPSRQTRPV